MALKKIVPLSEIEISFAVSAGPGGQNVNKTATKVVVRWSISKSKVFSNEEKELIRLKLGNRITKLDEFVVSSQTSRSQVQNRELAIIRLNQLVSKALLVSKKRRPTRPTKRSKLRNLETKRHTSLLKKMRKALE